MVRDLRLRGKSGTNGLMFVPYYGRAPRVFIANYKSWREYHNEGRIAEVASSLLSHETLHLTLNKFSLTASERLDNLFGRSNNWEAYFHGLGDLDERYPRSPFRSKGKNARRSSARRR
ncbi:MAG: hypothetical protein ABI361_01245 [Nitrososphaera sp.]